MAKQPKKSKAIEKKKTPAKRSKPAAKKAATRGARGRPGGAKARGAAPARTGPRAPAKKGPSRQARAVGGVIPAPAATAPEPATRRGEPADRGRARDGKALDHAALVVRPEALRFVADPKTFAAIARLKSAPKLREVVDFQDRALRSLRIGLTLDGPGYNIFVCGYPGSGRETAVRALLEMTRPPLPPAPDRVYVHSWRNPEQPRLIELPRGRGHRFRRDLDELIDFLRRSLPGVFDGDEFHRKRDRILRRWRNREQALLHDFDEEIRTEGFCLGQVPEGGLARPDVMVMVGRKALPIDHLTARVKRGELKVRGLERIARRHEELTEELEGILRRCRGVARKTHRALRELDRETALRVTAGLLGDLADRYDTPAVRAHLEELQESLLASIDLFLERDDPGPDGGDGRGGPPPPEPDELGPPPPRGPGDPFATFRANVVADNRGREQHPVVVENAPSWPNLFGTMEGESGAADFLRIRGGSLLRADGGYLVMDARDLMQETGVWRSLKRVLRHGQLEIQKFDPTLHAPISPVKPEPIQLHLKVVLMGDPDTYHQIDDADEDFRELFKVKAEFDSDAPNTPAGRNRYARVAARIAHEARLLLPDAGALARLVEIAVRDAGRRTRLSSRFREVADLLREADHIARRHKAARLTAEHVDRAHDERRRRHELGERKTAELLEEGLVLVTLRGRRVGQVNALTVYDLGDHVFGRPSRVTSAVSPGREGVVDIEHESKLGGETHHKGVQIVTGLLRERYAREHPLSLAATVCFEQSYADIDGDSASATELFAILSALSDLPIRQDLAVTGSVNQKGDVQAVGGTNEKVEGFYDACRVRGLTGTQGVVIPRANVDDLMLRADVIEAVEKGRFTVYAIDTIDQGMELLTGVAAGRRDPKTGEYPAASMNGLVAARLKAFAERMRRER